MVCGESAGVLPIPKAQREKRLAVIMNPMTGRQHFLHVSADGSQAREFL